MTIWDDSMDGTRQAAVDAARAAGAIRDSAVSVATAAAVAAVEDGIGDAVSTQLTDTGSAAYAALVGAAGTVTDPQVAAAVGGAGPTRVALDAGYAPKRYAHTVVLASDGSGTHSTVSSAFAALTTGARLLVKPRADGFAWAAGAAVTMPNVDNVSVEGYSRDGASITFPAGDGFVYDNTRRNSGWSWRGLRITGAGLDGSNYGINGTGLHLSDRCMLSDMRVGVFATGIYATGATGGCHYVRLENLRVANCTKGIGTTAGVGSTNGWTFTGGEFATNGKGISVTDSIVDSWMLNGTGFEGNGQAIEWNGNRSAFNDIRMETNTLDVSFTTSSVYNRLRTGFFDPAKHSDTSTQQVNTVEMLGFSTFVSPATPDVLNNISPAVAVTSISPGAANEAMVVTVTPERLMKLTSLSFAVATSAGNVDVAVADRAGTMLSTSGSTPMAAVNTVQTVPLPAPIYLLPRQRYYLFLAFDTITAAVAGVSSALTATYLANALDNTSRSKGSMFPLAGKTIAGMSSTGKTPWIRAG